MNGKVISSFILSSDNYYNLNKTSIQDLIIYNQDIYHSNNAINEDSNSITFNYQNQYSDNRFFGTDKDNTSRIVYGIETNFEMYNQKYNFNINQSYDLKKIITTAKN